MKVRSLRFKLGLNHGLIVAIMLSAVGVGRYQTVFYRAQRGFDQDLEEDARLFAAQFKISERGWDPLESTCRHASLSIL